MYIYIDHIQNMTDTYMPSTDSFSDTFMGI